MPVRGLYEVIFTKPASTTNTMPGIVRDVSAMFVARTTCRKSENTMCVVLFCSNLSCAWRSGLEDLSLLVRRKSTVNLRDNKFLTKKQDEINYQHQSLYFYLYLVAHCSSSSRQLVRRRLHLVLARQEDQNIPGALREMHLQHRDNTSIDIVGFRSCEKQKQITSTTKNKYIAIITYKKTNSRKKKKNRSISK
jgi:hypothetical protein